MIREREAVRCAFSDLLIAVLWTPAISHGEADTELHHIRVWKESGCVKAEIRKVR